MNAIEIPTSNQEILDLSECKVSQLRTLLISLARECSKRYCKAEIFDLPDLKFNTQAMSPSYPDQIKTWVLGSLPNVKQVTNIVYVNLYAGLPEIRDSLPIAGPTQINTIIIDKYCNCYQMLIETYSPEILQAKLVIKQKQDEIHQKQNEIAELKAKHNL